MKFLFFILTMAPTIAFSSLANNEGRWSKRTLSVCFSDGTAAERIVFRGGDIGVTLSDVVEFSENEKQTIISVLRENFSLSDVGITFTDFKDCHTAPQSDIHVLKFISQDPKTPAGRASMVGNQRYSWNCNNNLGSDCPNPTDIEYLNEREQPYVLFNFPSSPLRKTPNEARLKLLALHEFGHIAGLYHEHVRPERDSDKNCRDRGGDVLETPWELDPEMVFGPYDSNSVMNYCYLRMVNWVLGVEIFTNPGEELPILLTDSSIYSQFQEENRLRTVITPKLSSGDRETLRCLYIYEGDVFKDRCTKHFPH